eukprot:6768-Heterococcus_DN1.PRE.2
MLTASLCKQDEEFAEMGGLAGVKPAVKAEAGSGGVFAQQHYSHTCDSLSSYRVASTFTCVSMSTKYSAVRVYTHT